MVQKQNAPSYGDSPQAERTVRRSARAVRSRSRQSRLRAAAPGQFAGNHTAFSPGKPAFPCRGWSERGFAV